jgi:hypothetical protein
MCDLHCLSFMHFDAAVQSGVLQCTLGTHDKHSMQSKEELDTMKLGCTRLCTVVQLYTVVCAND